ncbi:MAG: DNA repair protein RecN [Candidatus Cloacimonadota bacterium]|nr:MAG: DNA repair protein RecN [Candidatus Cloacimonadota bacterium]PIE78200.1 MAG: DNA repair protein RecN [Candidatus Delongbacteria bacterium]
MILKLYIRNFLLINEIVFTPTEGLNVITGETGSGKSMLINAIMLLMGDRASGDMVRKGEKKVVVEAEFSVSEKIEKYLLKNGYDSDSTLIIRREILSSGKSRAFVNDSPAKVTTLKDLGEYLIDFHGQHDHQTLLNNKYHGIILDNFGNISIKEYKKQFAVVKKLRSDIENLINESSIRKERIELLRYHKDEIDKVSPFKGEDKDLENSLTTLENVERIKSITESIDNIVNGEEYSISQMIKELERKVSSISKFNSEFESYEKDIESAYYALNDLSLSAINYGSSLNFSEEEYYNISERYKLIENLKKKFSMSIEEILEYSSKIDEELLKHGDYDYFLEKKRDDLSKEEKVLEKLAQEITGKRVLAVPSFENRVNSQLQDLGLKNAEIEVSMSKLDSYSKYGMETIQFNVRTNKGEDFKPLSKTASGGEISRIMLAIKSVSRTGYNGAMVFDEIDTGISGSIADKVGIKLKEISKRGQLILITHLPIIAKRGDSHYKIFKTEDLESTFTGLKKLSTPEREEELMGMIGGSLEV